MRLVTTIIIVVGDVIVGALAAHDLAMGLRATHKSRGRKAWAINPRVRESEL
jgi:hypothetical protein